MTSNSDMIKNALINEIEENLSQNTNSIFKTRIIDSITTALQEQDHACSKESLERALKYGIDPIFRDWEEMSPSSNGPSVSSPEKITSDTSFMEEQYASFLSNVDTLEYETLTRDEEDGESSEPWTASERIKSLNLPRAHFEHFFQTTKINRPQLYRSIHQHALFNASVKQKKKKSRRDKKRERKDKRSGGDNQSTSPDTTLKIISSQEDQGTDSDPISLIHSKSEEVMVSLVGLERKRDITVTLFVAKCIAEGTTNSILLAILYLIHVYDHEHDIEAFTLPLAGMVAAMLGYTSFKDGKSSHQGKDSTDTSIRKFALTSKNLSFRADSVSEASGENSRSIDENTSLMEDGISQVDSYFHSAYSETGSTIGSVTVEVGTEGTSLDYEISEEEMLAQALAMSLVVESTTPKASSTTSSNTQPSSLDAIKQREKLQTPSSEANRKSSSSDDRLSFNIRKVPIDPMSTFGPLESPEAYDDVDFDTSANISVLSTIVALMIVLSANCDRMIGDNPSPELVQLADTFQILSKSSSSTSSRSVMELSFQPNHVTFQLIEYVMEIFTDKICRDLKNSTQPSPLPSKHHQIVNLQTLCWCLTASIKILKGHLYLTQLHGSTYSILTAGSVSELAFAISFGATPPLPSSTPLLTRLTTHLINLMHMDVIKIDDSIHAHSSGGGLSHAFHIINQVDIIGHDQHRPYDDNLAYYHHAIRMHAIYAFTTAFGVFLAHTNDRECLIRNLLTTPISSSLNQSLSMNSYPKAKEFPMEYFHTVLLQMLCNAEGRYGNVFMFHEDHGKNLMFSSNASDTSTSPDTMNEPVGFSPSSSPSSSSESKIVYVHCPFTIDDNMKFVDSVESLILRRLKSSYSYIDDDKMHTISTDVSNRPSSYHHNPLYDTLYYGEYTFILSQHQYLSYKVLDTYKNKDSVLRFNPKTSSSYLSYNDDDKNVSHRGPKKWISSTAQHGFAPNTGIHEVLYRIDKCDKGQIFLGLSSYDNTLSLRESYYLGYDHHSWGFMGNGTLWHNKMKVRSDYGTNVNNRALMKMRYDSNRGTLSYSFGDAAWGIAFANLPKEILYASVSLHDKDDKVSILGYSIISNDDSSSNKRDSLKSRSNDASSHNHQNISSEKDDIISYIRYMQTILALTEELIIECENQSDMVKKAKILSHPYFGVFIPSLSSMILSMKLKPSYDTLLSFQCLPYLIIFIKRLYSIYESLPDTASTSSLHAYGIINGDWKFRSSGNSSSFPSQEYMIKLEKNITIDNNNECASPSNEGGYRNDMLPYRFSGSGKDHHHGKNVAATGSQYGVWLKFLESWESGGDCFVDGKVSLCGTFFHGRYTDVASNKSGVLDGMLINGLSLSRVNTKNIIFKAMMLLTKCCGKLSGSFIIGMHLSDEHQIIPSLSESISSTSEPDESPSPSSEMITSQESEQNVLSVKAEILRWTQSNLFSNGFPIDEDFIVDLSLGIEAYFPANQDSGSPTAASKSKTSYVSYAEAGDGMHAYAGVISWWLGRVFPTLNAINNNDDKHHDISSHLTSSELHPLLSQIISGSGDGAKLDEYVLQHSNASPLVKVGGEPMIVARRLIIGALIRHSGTISLCQAEVNIVVQGMKNNPDSRPHPIILEVWKASQRIIENLIRQRQKTGFTYAAISKSICSKAELLLKLMPSDTCMAVADSLSMLASELVSKDIATQSETDSDIHKDCTKLISDVIDFLTCSIRSVDDLKMNIFHNAVKAYSRTAGFKSIMMLLQRIDAPSKFKPSSLLSAISSFALQPIVMEYVLLSLYGYHDLQSSSAMKSWSNVMAGMKISDDQATGHYMSDLHALSTDMKKSLKDSFESVYEFNTQLLSRCTWFGDRDGQFLALSAWGISISPSDHVFLNRVGIFRILQTVLDDVRAAIVDVPKRFSSDSSSASSSTSSDADLAHGPFAAPMVMSSIKRLSQLALRIVHSLASQVAFTKDTISSLSQTAVPKLIRMPSGPDTLSVSLFEMLYSELFSGLKRIISRTMTSCILSSDQAKSDEKGQEVDKENDEDSLDGEPHIDRILKLLFFVSTAKSCHKALSSAKWLSLLVAALGCGNMPIQRRVFRLLRRIISNMQPDNVKAFIAGFYHSRDEYVTADAPLDDADLESYVESVDEMDANESHILFGDDPSSVSPADRLIVLLMEGISVLSPSSSLSESPSESELRYHQLLSYYRREKLSGFISAESLVFLRVLLGIPSWRQQIYNIVLKVIHAGLNDDDSTLHENNWQKTQYLMLLSASFSICGGYIDRLRPGGMVTLKPFTLASMTDSFANKLASTIHTTGMMICQSALGDNVEVVLMERGMRYVKPESTLSPSSQSSNQDDKTIHFTTSVNGSLPVRAVRLNCGDVLPSYDVPFISETISKEYLTDGIVHVLINEVIPWMKTFLKNHKPLTSFSMNRRIVHETESRRNIESEAVDREMGDSENDDNVEEDIDVGSEEEEDDQEKEDDYDQISDHQQLLEHDEGRSSIISEPGEAMIITNNRSDSQVDINTTSLAADYSDALKLQVRVSSMRSLSIALLNDTMGTSMSESSISVFQDLLRLSIVETQCGGLNIIESAEEKWSVYWDAYCNAVEEVKVKAPSTTGNTTSEDTKRVTRTGMRSEDHELQHQLRRESETERQGTLAENSPFAPFILGRSIDPAAKAEAISQMMDMGLPREWCETSLRRCRYNIEMAINMCFEHGEDMGRFVAEDAALLAVQSSRDRDRERSTERESSSWRRRALVPDEPTLSSSSTSSTAASIANLTRALSRSRAYRQDISDSMASARQLLDMGFPPNWCSRAMEESGNDVGGALAWILSHSEDLANTLVEEREPTGTSESTDQSTPLAEESFDINKFNPLESVSGIANITSDLICTVADDGFPSVGCRGFAVSSGKWYFELTLHSSGCIQIGWVDTGYVGGADTGQGVGDDIHSWAFDGWRTYLWHEISTPWGARWAAGDVVGCMIDIDNRIMGFTLNGLSTEIDMGEAFTDFTFEGGLYPCASFNKREKVQFNFGGSPFKYEMPAGYMQYMNHINNVRNQNINLSKVIKNDIFRNAVIGLYSSSPSSSGQNHPQSVSMFENALEESSSSYDKQSNSIRRYFSEDASRSNIDRNVKLPLANISGVIPSDKKKIYDQLAIIAKDLCILYARQSILRLFQSYPKLSEVARSNLASLLSNPDDTFSQDYLKFSLPSIPQRDDNHAGLSCMETLLFLLKINGIHSNRTKIYLHTLSLSPASITPHHLLGSFTSIGGAPFYDALKSAMTHLIRQSRDSSSNKHIVDHLIQSVVFDCVNAIRRNQNFDYRHEGGLSPAHVITESITSNAGILSANTLMMATWVTGILLEQFAHEISYCNTSSSSSSSSREEIISDIGHWLTQLTDCWSIALRSPSVYVKTCASQMLSSLIQEHSYSSTRFVSLPKSFVVDMLSKVALDRIRTLVIERLHFERSSLPICSEYLQSLVELFVSLNHCSVYIQGNEPHASQKFIDDYSTEIPQIEMKCDLESADFNWEVCSGRLFSDADSMIVWTGSLIQNEINSLPPSDRRSTDRTEYPPELMKGCRVMRKVMIKAPPKTEETEGSSKEGSEPSVMSPESANVPESEVAELIPRLIGEDSSSQSSQRFFERLKATQGIREGSNKSSSNEESSSKEGMIEHVELGTVVEVCAWNDDLPGTARLIKWDEGEDEVEKVRWGSGGRHYDVTHAKIVNGKVSGEYPKPILRDAKVVNQYFGSKLNYGIILRLRKAPRMQSDAISITHHLIGVMEFSDFGCIIYVEGTCSIDGSWMIQEKKLISGPNSANWSVRFGDNKWIPGTTYHLQPSSLVSDASDEFCQVMNGSFSYTVNVPYISTRVRGEINVQRARLFFFDDKFHSSNVAPSWDRLSITKNSSGSGQGSAFGTVGFSTGVHYWEFKVEQAEVGSVFIGVSEKPGPPGLTSSSKCTRWMGCGFVSHRASYRAASMNASERVAVYGDYFHTGDIIGVLLDMNKGRLSFFLDGMKYGEHTVADLGEAFDGLATPLRVKPKVLYPVVGLSRHQDRVTITPRWLSSIGCHPEEELRTISRAWRLFASWSIDRPTNKPSDMNLWAYRDAWRDWSRWLSGKYLRIRSRCKSSAILVDISPEACVKASIRLGLSTALFHGDRVSFEKSSGRKLETKEEAVILGVYQGQLWFRHDSQQGSTSLSESTAVAWSLAQNDVEGLIVIRRSMIQSPFILPQAIIDLPLPRMKQFRGGLVTLTLASGAAMRNGLEIDTSDMIREIAANTALYSIETRLNSSNIIRHKVLFSGAIGWISERMRGGAEEVIITRQENISEQEAFAARDEVVRLAAEINATDRIIWDDVDTLGDAMTFWRQKIVGLGYASLTDVGGILSSAPIAYSPPSVQGHDPFSFENYLLLATTIDNHRNWTVEADMQLAEILTKTAAKDAVAPQNLSSLSLSESLKAIDNASSQLYHVDVNRAIARAAVLRVANQVIGYALPYLDFTLPEERARRDVAGSDDEIEISTTNIPITSEPHRSSATIQDYDMNMISNVKSWLPPTWGRRLRSMRRILFGQTKRIFWESVIESTTTFTPMHQDEYEDPREIKTISINRIKATPSKLMTYANIHERLKQSVFGQLHKELRNWSDASYRRSYVGKGHGGQKRFFKVKFLGEGVNDYGGPYRAVYEQVIDELQCDRSIKSSEKSLLPLLIPSNNRGASVGSIQDKFVLSTSPTTSPAVLELMHFFGKLLGSAVRQNLHLALDLSAMVWRPLVRLPVSRAHLETVDSLAVKSLDDITKKGIQLEQDTQASYPPSYIPDEWEDFNFMIYLPDGSRIPLLPGGEDQRVNLGNWRLYVTLTERCRLRESVVMLKAMRDGLSTVLPVDLLPLFTPNEFEQIISGNSNVDISLLRQCTEYEDISPDDMLVTNFWQVLEEFTAEERTLFLRFVWARSRMPSSAEDLMMNFKLQLAQGDARSKPDQYLPHAQTCFFSLSLPPYTSKDIMKEKLLYAIHNSPNMDADVRLHHAEGWADA